MKFPPDIGSIVGFKFYKGAAYPDAPDETATGLVMWIIDNKVHVSWSPHGEIKPHTMGECMLDLVDLGDPKEPSDK